MKKLILLSAIVLLAILATGYFTGKRIVRIHTDGLTSQEHDFEMKMDLVKNTFLAEMNVLNEQQNKLAGQIAEKDSVISSLKNQIVDLNEKVRWNSVECKENAEDVYFLNRKYWKNKSSIQLSLDSTSVLTNTWK